jgi:hypothetical protein
MDFFTVPTLTGPALFVFVLFAHHRRRIVHFAITDHPTAAWFRRRVAGLGITEVITSPSSPWQIRMRSD